MKISRFIVLALFLSSSISAYPAFPDENSPLQAVTIKDELAAKEPILKKIDINRISAAPYYETFEGCRLGMRGPLKYFSIAQRVEIYQEPKPIDAHILDAKKIRWLHLKQPWDTAADYRAQASKPIFTRSYGTEVTMSDPVDKEGQIRYTHDYRDIYGNQFPIYLEDIRRNVNYKIERWDQNEILIMHQKRILPIDWFSTINFGYRYSTMNGKNDGSTFSYYENRHTYFSYFSLAPSERLEFFGQVEYFKSKRPHVNFLPQTDRYCPDHYFYATEIRMKSKDMKTSYIPRISYSLDKFYPFYNRLHKTEIQFRLGHDFNKRLSATTTEKYVLSIRNEVDNAAPTYGRPNPVNDMGAWVGTENRIQYNIYDRFWLQGGVDYSAGTNMSDFDNVGLLGGLEYYAPGLMRIDVGWRGNHYYNIDDYLSTIYFKFYLFM